MPESLRCTHGPVTSEQLVRLATLLNDFNPAHYDLTFATSVGLPGVIAPGTLLQGWVLSDIEAHWGASGEPHTLGELDLRLRQPFLVGETVEIDYERDDDTVRATAAALTPGSDDRRVVATASVTLGRASDAR